MLINSTIRKLLIAMVTVLLVTPAISPFIPSKTSLQTIERETNKETQAIQEKLISCKVFTPEGLYEAERKIPMDKLEALESMFDETAKAMRLLHNSDINNEEKEKAVEIIYKTVNTLKELQLIPDGITQNDMIKLLTGENKINLEICNESLIKFERVNIGCIIWGKGRTMYDKLYLFILDELSNDLHKKYPKIAKLLRKILYKLSEMDEKIPVTISILSGFCGGSIRLKVTGLLGTWNLYGGVSAVMIGFTGIWTEDFILGYAPFIGLEFYDPHST